MNSVTFCIPLASLSRLVWRHLLIYSITSAISSLFSSSGKALSCCLFASLTNFIDLGQGWTVQFTVLSGFRPPIYLVLTTTNCLISIILEKKKVSGFILFINYYQQITIIIQIIEQSCLPIHIYIYEQTITLSPQIWE